MEQTDLGQDYRFHKAGIMPSCGTSVGYSAGMAETELSHSAKPLLCSQAASQIHVFSFDCGWGGRGLLEAVQRKTSLSE